MERAPTPSEPMTLVFAITCLSQTSESASMLTLELCSLIQTEQKYDHIDISCPAEHATPLNVTHGGRKRPIARRHKDLGVILGLIRNHHCASSFPHVRTLQSPR